MTLFIKRDSFDSQAGIDLSCYFIKNIYIYIFGMVLKVKKHCQQTKQQINSEIKYASFDSFII